LQCVGATKITKGFTATPREGKKVLKEGGKKIRVERRFAYGTEGDGEKKRGCWGLRLQQSRLRGRGQYTGCKKGEMLPANTARWAIQV